MNTIENELIRSPNDAEEECIKFTIDDTEEPFALNEILLLNQIYTFSAWIKADVATALSVGGKTIEVETGWERKAATFTSDSEELEIYFTTPGIYYMWHPQLEIGVKATDYRINPDDLEEELYNVSLKLTKDGITSIVGAYYATPDDVTAKVNEVQTTITQTAKDLTVKITDAAKTATNFLKYDGGLIVGEIPQAENEVLENNVLISTNDVQIRNGETILAKYAGNQIDLGCSGNISAIKLLNGIGEIKAVYNEDYETKDIEITGKTCATLSSPEVAGLTAANGDYASYVRCYTNGDSPMVSIVAVDPVASKSGSIKVNPENILVYTGGMVEIEGALVITEDVKSSGNITTDGNIYCDSGRIKSEGIYTTTGTSPANMVISDKYWMYRSTSSSKRYKHDIKPLGENLNSEKLLNIPVHQYIYNLDYLGEEDQRYSTVVPGFIAEEVYEHYPIAVEITDGQVEDWNHRMIIPPMLDLIQKLWNRVDELERML